MSEKLTLQELESHLWGAANILRGKIDSANFKTYIFGLFFFKRLCEVWQEEYEEKLAIYQNSELAADLAEQQIVTFFHRFKEGLKLSILPGDRPRTNLFNELNMTEFFRVGEL